jgi:hypothetical protein
LSLRDKYGYSFEQLSDLELETELVLCGLLEPKMYKVEVEKRLGITRSRAHDLVNEMNTLVFKKIREKLIEIADEKKKFEKNIRQVGLQKDAPGDAQGLEHKEDLRILKETGIHVISENAGKVDLNLPELKESNEKTLETEEESIMQKKLTAAFQIKKTETEHKFENLSSTGSKKNEPVKPNIKSVDPYREVPE